ncbi:hypothetical protein [Petrimonas sp.]|uniref:hypothetical protein n=1 Tax=Petrimonas sp. TaxID=2023866 RepID=UPI003F5140C6
MKKVFVFLFCMLSIYSYSQQKAEKVSQGKITHPQAKNKDISTIVPLSKVEQIMRDTIPQVIYTNKEQKKVNPNDRKPIAFFLNSELVDEIAMRELNPEYIENFNITRRTDTVINNANYDGVVHIALKEGVKLNFITLNQLRDKYLRKDNLPVLFLIDGIITDVDYDTYLIDEFFVYKIFVEKMTNEKEGLSLNIVNILTKKRETIEKENEFWIRGVSTF